MSYAARTIDSIDWSGVQVLRGSGRDLPSALLKFVGCEDGARMSELWWGLEGVIFSQDTIYEAAEPTTDVLMAALLDDRPQATTAWILEALRFILTGGSEDDPDLPARCRDRARRGSWLLVTVSKDLAGLDRDSVLELLDLLDPKVAAVARSGGATGTT